jgi:hypothetical protein
MTRFKKTMTASLAALTLASAVLTSTAPAEARGGYGYGGGALAAGMIGGLAFGAMAAQAAQPRTVYVVEPRRVRKHHRAHRHDCGCVHHIHHY